MSGSEPVIHFGWPASAEAESLNIEWPSGRIQSIEGLVSGWHYRITESGSETKGSSDKGLNSKDLYGVLGYASEEEAIHRNNLVIS